MWCTQPLLARIYIIFPEPSKPTIRCYKCVKSVSFESFPVGILTKQACLLQPFLLRTHRLLAFLMQISLHLLATFFKGETPIFLGKHPKREGTKMMKRAKTTVLKFIEFWLFLLKKTKKQKIIRATTRNKNGTGIFFNAEIWHRDYFITNYSNLW